MTGIRPTAVRSAGAFAVVILLSACSTSRGRVANPRTSSSAESPASQADITTTPSTDSPHVTPSASATALGANRPSKTSPAGGRPSAGPAGRAAGATASGSGKSGAGAPAGGSSGSTAGAGSTLAPASSPTLAGAGPGGGPGTTPTGPGLRSLVVAGVPVPGPAAAGTQTSASTTCPAGTLLVSGGALGDLVAGGAVSPSLRLMGSVPSDAAGNPAVSGAGSASWSVLLAAGGQALSGAQTRQFALCADGGQLGSTRVVVASAAGPADPGSSVAATATCPGGTVLLGGGGLTGSPASSPPNPSLHLIGSFPSNAGGSPVGASGSEASSWTATADSGGAAIVGASTTAYAICGSGLAATTVQVERVPGPGNGTGEALDVTASCPAGRVLLGGGANIDLNGGTPQWGVHLRGSYPSDAAGHPGTNGKSADSWTSAVEDGGQAAPGTSSTSFAVCSA
jgi:hypothetical protein